MTLKSKLLTQNVEKNAKHLIGLSNKNKRARISIGLASEDANNIISPRMFLECFALKSFEMQYE